MTGNRIPPSSWEELVEDMAAETQRRAENIQTWRDRLTEDFEAGKLRIVNGWLVADAGKHTCGMAGELLNYYGHEPGCGWEPIMDLCADNQFADDPAPA